MFVIIKSDPDETSTKIIMNEEKAMNSYFHKVEELDEHDDHMVLAKVNEDSDFGFGARGDFFGGEILEEFPAE